MKLLYRFLTSNPKLLEICKTEATEYCFTVAYLCSIVKYTSNFKLPHQLYQNISQIQLNLDI